MSLMFVHVKYFHLTIFSKRSRTNFELADFIFDIGLIGPLKFVKFSLQLALRVRLILIRDLTCLTNFRINRLRILFVEHICDELSDFNYC